MSKPKILLIGPRTNTSDASQTGGAIVLFEILLSDLEKENISFKVIDTNKKNYLNFVIAYVSILFKIFFKQFGVKHISLHSSSDYMFFAPVIILLGKVFRKKTSLRKFGGDAETSYSSAKGLKKSLLKFSYEHIDFVFMEMKYLVCFFRSVNPSTFWFPNVRHRDKDSSSSEKKYSKKFVFISHVKREKGIDQILEASLRLDTSYSIDIYGPISDKKYSIEYFKNFNVNYHGAIDSTKVNETLKKYDILLLPTFYKGEGYPGIIIEAYGQGIPVISTSWQGIVEIVENKKTGILVEPKNTEALLSAMEFFTESNYREMSKNAYLKFGEFESKEKTRDFLKNIQFYE